MQVNVPHGHVLARIKWKNSKLVQILRDSCNVIFEDRFDCVDFFTSRETALVVMDENEISNGTTFRRSLVKLRQVNLFQGIVLIQKNPNTESYLRSLQKFILMDLGLKCVPYVDWNEAGAFIIQLVNLEINPKSNIFFKSSRNPNCHASYDENVLTMLSCIPKLGSVKSKILIKSFPSLQSICNAEIEDLAPIVGSSIAYEIKKFFTSYATKH